MTWFRVDDGFWSHPKTMYLSGGAVALWTRAGAYCGQHLTDGFVDERTIAVLRGTDDEATELVEAGLWHEAEGGYQFHDWHKYQDTRAEVERRRESWKERQRKHRGQSEENENHSSLLEEPSPIPFHSTQARDSRRDTQRESQRDAGKDDPNFQAFWALYPRKEGKGAARTAYRKACRNVPPEVLLEAVQRYASDPNRDAAYTAHASTWLNQERWDDAPLPQREAATAGDKRMERNRRLIEWAAEQDAQDSQPALEAW
jgi:hypothetical protein